jgi:putative redox protein
MSVAPDTIAAARIRAFRTPRSAMKLRVKWVEGVTFLGETESNHAIVMDGAPEGGGRNLGPRPMETLLAGAGGCTAYDVVTILKKSRQDIVDVAVEMDADRAATDPKVFTRIHLHFVVKGRKLRPEAVERAIELSATKYCSASIMLGKTAEITHDFEIVEIDAAATAGT